MRRVSDTTTAVAASVQKPNTAEANRTANTSRTSASRIGGSVTSATTATATAAPTTCMAMLNVALIGVRRWRQAARITPHESASNAQGSGSSTRPAATAASLHIMVSLSLPIRTSTQGSVAATNRPTTSTTRHGEPGGVRAAPTTAATMQAPAARQRPAMYRREATGIAGSDAEEDALTTTDPGPLAERKFILTSAGPRLAREAKNPTNRHPIEGTTVRHMSCNPLREAIGVFDAVGAFRCSGPDRAVGTHHSHLPRLAVAGL